jgi:hypothetical protein
MLAGQRYSKLLAPLCRAQPSFPEEADQHRRNHRRGRCLSSLFKARDPVGSRAGRATLRARC